MRVQLKLGDRVEIVRDVNLRDGYRPVVDGSAPSTIGRVFHIDCALWYKTYLLDAVYIDCDDRQVYWIRKDSTCVKTIYDTGDNNKFVPPEAEKLIGDMDIYDFDPTIDELTDLANDYMSLYVNKKISRKELCTEVARMLHCYIFPSVKFKKGDIPALQDALMLIKGKSECLDAEILQKLRSVDTIENSLRIQRKRIITNEKFQSELYVRSCKKVFLVLFYKDIEKDVMRLNGQFEGMQLQVNRYRDCKLEGTKVKLQDLRKERDNYYEELKSLQHAKETLRNVLFRRSVLKKKVLRKIKVKVNIFHDIYLEMSDRFRQRKEDLQRSCLAKVKVSSVREAILTTLSELRTFDDGYISRYPSDGSEFRLDVDGIVQKPEDWKTLEEKVYSLLENHKSRVYLKHHQACKMIKDKITSAIADTKMFGVSAIFREDVVSINSIDVRFLEELGESSRQRRRGRPRSTLTLLPDLGDNIDYLAADALRKSMEGLLDDVKSHIEAMGQMLMNSLPISDGCHNFIKIWVVYESIFYLETLPHLCELYERAYKPKCQKLYGKISCLTLEDMLQDDKIVNMIVATMESDRPLTPSCMCRRPVSSPSSEFETIVPIRSDRVSAVSLEIKKCTLQELYTMADSECSQLTGSITNLMDENRCIPSGSMDEESTHGQGTRVKAVPGSEEEEEDGEEDVFDVEPGEDDIVLPIGDESEQNLDVQIFLDSLFHGIKVTLQTLFKANTVLDKLRVLTKVFRSLSGLLAELSEKTCVACCDEMLSVIIILLRCLDKVTFVNLYASVILLIDLRAPFLSGSVHDCSLTNFFGAFDYLFSRQLCWHGTTTSGCAEGPLYS